MTDVDVRPSGIEGLGVFAARAFRAGDRIRRVNVVREITPEAPLREDLGERADHCNYPDGKVVLYGLPDRCLNHSCHPNAYEVFEEGAIWWPRSWRWPPRSSIRSTISSLPAERRHSCSCSCATPCSWRWPSSPSRTS